MERADVMLMQEAAGCAPLHVTGPVVERVRAMLALTASSTAWRLSRFREARLQIPGKICVKTKN
jgi:hypothetical protein